MSKKKNKSDRLLKAISFSARAHQGQFRRDKVTPYVSHPFRVCMILRHTFGVKDEKVLMAAVLHDTIEDTTTDFDDIKEEFGKDVAVWVAWLSKDMRESQARREKQYIDRLRNAPDTVKLAKLADIYDNLSDAVNGSSRRQLEKTLNHTAQYLKALSSGRKSLALKRAFGIVLALREKIGHT